MKNYNHSLRLTLASLCLSLISISGLRAASIALDQNFHPPFFSDPAYAARALLLPDGKYLLYFNVGILPDQPTGALMRFLPDGTFDTSFDFSRDYFSVFAVAALPDGRLIIAASKDVYGVFEQAEHILRVNTDGSIDPTFNVADALITDPANHSSGPLLSSFLRASGLTRRLDFLAMTYHVTDRCS